MISQTLPSPELSNNCYGLGKIFHSVEKWYQSGAVVAITCNKKALILHDCEKFERPSDDYFRHHWTIYIDATHYPSVLNEWQPFLEAANCYICNCSLAGRVCRPEGIPNVYCYEIPAPTATLSQTSRY